MAGHSPWKNIQHKKALIDAKRGKLWTKLSKAITVAARLGGPDTAVNVRLRTAILDARAVSMPKENIERAIKAGTGESKGNDVEEVLYEGYGPGGVAIMCEIMTDNRNRTAPEIRKVFEKAEGQLGKTGCVNYLFERKGFFAIAEEKATEDKLMEVALDSGADDVKHAAGQFEITCPPDAFIKVLTALEQAGIEADVKQITRIPLSTVDVDAETAKTVLSLLEALDDHDDVQSVVSNCNIPEDAVAG
jgi:YebC/PmpR family DNA-binding regulatory protein